MCINHIVPRNRLTLHRLGAALVLAGAMIAGTAATAAPAEAPTPVQTPGGVRYTRYGTSSFPYGRSDEASAKTQQLASGLGDLYVVQLDDGVPWAEALEDREFPLATRRKWEELLSHAPLGKTLYLALEPLAADRVTLAPASSGSSLPPPLRAAAYDSAAMRAAYLNYARRAVRYFSPTFLNLGVENGELAHRDPAKWPAYVSLIKSVMQALHVEYPAMKQGISYGLQSLMEPATAARARALVEASDYVGLSFYPYMSSFQEKFHLPALPAPPDEWRAPLNWLRSYTRKPVAICETGYNTRDVQLADLGIRMKGDANLQATYIHELAGFAARDHYLFVVYYLPIDIDEFLGTLPRSERSAASMWGENGLFGSDLAPKAGLTEWRRVIAQPYQALASGEQVVAADSSSPAAAGMADGSHANSTLLFTRAEDLCQAPAPAQSLMEGPGTSQATMRWSYPQVSGTWSWCSRKFRAGAFPRGAGMSLRIRSDRDVQLVLQLKQADGTAHYAAIPAGPAWREVALGWNDFRLDEHTGRDTRVHPESVVEMVLADEGKGSVGSGQQRDVWMSQWQVR